MATKKKEEVKNNKLTAILEFIGIIIAVIIIEVFFQGTVICNIVTLLLMLTLLITVHEWGHFIMCKKFGVHVYEFAIGMGPKLMEFRRKNDPTVYTIRALPIGGYNQLAGEQEEDDKKLKKDQFLCNKPKLQKIIILCAGVFMNCVTAIVLLFIVSLSFGYTEQKSILGKIDTDSPAYEVGLREGDTIIEYNGQKVSTWDEITIIGALKNQPTDKTYKVIHEDGTEGTYTVSPVDYVVYGNDYFRLTEEKTKAKIAEELKVEEKDLKDTKLVGVSQSSKRYTGFVNAVKYAFTKFWGLTKLLVKTLVYLFTGQIGMESLSGPVGMYKVVGQASKYGIANIIFLTAYLSINLAIINILPFPAVDGGHVLFVIIEAITGKKVSPAVENIFHTIGFILFFLLLIIITGHDIWSLFGK